MMRIHEIALIVSAERRYVVVILTAVALHVAVTFYLNEDKYLHNVTSRMILRAGSRKFYESENYYDLRRLFRGTIFKRFYNKYNFFCNDKRDEGGKNSKEFGSTRLFVS